MRAWIFAVGAALIVVFPSPASAASYIESFENGMGGWEADHYVACEQNQPPCTPLLWSVQLSQEQASDGQWSVRTRAFGGHDDGTVWIERPFKVEANAAVVRVKLTFDAYSSWGHGPGEWWISAAVMATNPEQESDFAHLGRDDFTGWRTFQTESWVPVGQCAAALPCVWVGLGVDIEFEVWKDHYFDHVRVEFL